MQLKHKVGLGLLGAAAAAGLGYCAYLHRGDILAKIEELKNEIEAKKNALGEAGNEKIAVMIDGLIAFLEKHNPHDQNPKTKEAILAEIEKLKAELKSFE